MLRQHWDQWAAGEAVHLDPARRVHAWLHRPTRGDHGRHATSGLGAVATGQPHNQEHDEWVVLVAGSAGLWIEGEGERDLHPDDYVLIPAHRPHRVTWTAKGYEFSLQARDDLQEIWAYVASDNPGAADKLEEDIYAACELLAKAGHRVLQVSRPSRSR